MYTKAVEFIKSKISVTPQIGLILGSGLGGLAERMDAPQALDYKDIPGFLSSTAPGHAGRLVFGSLSGRPVVCMQGRFHLYEGYDVKDIVFPIRVMKLLGVETLILTNAAGGINIDYNVGDLMVINDHINFTGENPLVGANDPIFGTRFPDMSKAYDPALRELVKEAVCGVDIRLREGVYLACKGPSYETPAEIRAFRIWGADAVGMSTVPEVIAANHCGMKVLALSLITNMAAGVLDKPLTEQEVIEIGNKKSGELQKLVRNLLEIVQ